MNMQYIYSRMISFQIEKKIMSDAYISQVLKRVDRERTHNISYYNPQLPFPRDGGTSHTSVMTSDGASVALTSSINGK